MRRAVIAVVIGAIMLVGLAAWRSPTAAIMSLKLALDADDLPAVSRVLDRRALTDAALGRLLEDHTDEPTDVRLVLRGESTWIPAVASARAFLRTRLERGVERLVEDPEHALDVTWEDVRRALATLRRSGAVARFRYRGRDDAEYAIRMRRSGGRWRIVSVERDGDQVLLGPATPPPAAEQVVANGTTAPSEATTGHHMAMMIDEATALVRTTPPPRPRGGKRSPFVRRLDDDAWTIQVASTQDAVEAELEREWFESLGEPAFVREAEIRGETWQRVLVGRYPTRGEAERTIARVEARLETHP